nr:hypothetical protein CFP56_07946 [Quercus suber]
MRVAVGWSILGIDYADSSPECSGFLALCGNHTASVPTGTSVHSPTWTIAAALILRALAVVTSWLNKTLCSGILHLLPFEIRSRSSAGAVWTLIERAERYHIFGSSQVHSFWLGAASGNSNAIDSCRLNRRRFQITRTAGESASKVTNS